MKGWAHTEDILWREDWAKEKNDPDGNLVLVKDHLLVCIERGQWM
jgi:hypothetical protein